MNDKHLTKAGMFFLADINDDSEILDWKIPDLKNANGDLFAKMMVNVWEPFEDYRVEELLREINNLAELFEDVEVKFGNEILNIMSYDDIDEYQKLEAVKKYIKKTIKTRVIMTKKQIETLNKCQKHKAKIALYKEALPHGFQMYGCGSGSPNIDHSLDKLHRKMHEAILKAYEDATEEINLIIDDFMLNRI